MRPLSLALLLLFTLNPHFSYGSDIYPFIDVSGYATITAGTVLTDDSFSQAAYRAKRETDRTFYNDSEISFYPNTNVGIQADISLSPDLSITSQVAGRGTNKWDPELSILLMNYQVDEHWKIQLGRKHSPIFHYSGHEDVGAAYTWVSPPLLSYADSIHKADGIYVYYNTPVSEDLLLTINLWRAKRSGFSPSTTKEAEDNDAVGLRSHLEGGNWNANFYYVRGNFIVDGRPPVGYYFGGWSSAYEGEHWQIFTEQTAGFFESGLNDYTTLMAAVGYRIGSFTPYLMGSTLHDTNDRLGDAVGSPSKSSLQQYSLGARWDITSSHSLKFELSRILNTSDQPDSLSGGSYAYWNNFSAESERVNGLLVPTHTTLARISLSVTF